MSDAIEVLVMMTPIKVLNFAGNLPAASEHEVAEQLLAAEGVRLERIVSHGQASPPGFWYDQSEAEWVMVVAGAARLAIDGQAEELLLGPGDAVYLPAHCRHRVSWTDPDQPTVWLALFVSAALDPTDRPAT